METLRPCASQPCGALVSTGLCAAHALQHGRANSTTEKGYDGDWRRLRAKFLRALCEQCAGHPVATCQRCSGSGLANRYCAECLAEGRFIRTEQVDHVFTIRERPELRLCRTNLQGLCATHHSRKTHADRHGIEPSKFQLEQFSRVLAELELLHAA